MSEAWRIGLAERQALDGEARLVAAQSRALVEADQISRSASKNKKRRAAPSIFQSTVPSFVLGAALAFFLLRRKRRKAR